VLNAGGGALDPAARNKIIKSAFGERSELTGPERAVLRAAATAGGFLKDVDNKAFSPRSDEKSATDAMAKVDTELWQAYARETEAANASLAKAIGNRVGSSAMSRRLEGGTEAQVTAVSNTAKLLRILSGVDPETEDSIKGIIDQPLTPNDQKVLDSLDVREEEIANQDRIMLLGEAKTMMRTDPSLRKQVVSVVEESSDKRAAAVAGDQSLAGEKKEAAAQKVEADRSELLRKANTAHGRRLAAGLMREGRRAGRGALGAEVKADGTIERDVERKITLPEGVAQPTTGQEHRKVLQTVAGFGHGGAQQVFSRPKPAAPAATAPAAEPKARSAEMEPADQGAPEPAAPVAAIDKQMRTGAARRESLLARLAALRGDTGTA